MNKNHSLGILVALSLCIPTGLIAQDLPVPPVPVGNTSTGTPPPLDSLPMLPEDISPDVPSVPATNPSVVPPAPSTSIAPAPPVPTDNTNNVPALPSDSTIPAPPIPSSNPSLVPPIPAENPAPAPAVPADNSIPAPPIPSNSSIPAPPVPTDNTSVVPPMPASNPTPVPPAASDNSIPAPAVPANYPPVAPPAPPAVAVPVPAVPVPAVPISNAPVAAPQPANAAPLQALPANNPIAAPPATANLSTFRDAIWTGYRATQTKQWQFALVAFRAALPLAQTPKELNYTQHWVHYTCVQMGIPATPVPPLSSAAPPASAPSVLSMNVPASPTTAQQVSAPPVAIPLVPAPAAPATQASAPKPTPTATPIELSAFHAYKSLKWGSPLAQFMKLKKAKGPIEKNGVSQGFGTDQTQLSLPIDLLLSNFKGAPEADLLNIYSKKEDVYYLFYQNKFAMVAGVLSNGSYPEILRQFKEKFKTIKSFDHSAQDEFGLNYKVEYEQFESSNGVSAYLIKNTRDYSGQTVVDTLFVYVPKDQLEEIQSVTLEKIKKESTTQNKRRDPDIEKDIKKL